MNKTISYGNICLDKCVISRITKWWLKMLRNRDVLSNKHINAVSDGLLISRNLFT